MFSAKPEKWTAKEGGNRGSGVNHGREGERPCSSIRKRGINVGEYPRCG